MVRQSAVRIGVCGGARSHLNIILVNHGVTEVWNWTGLVACVPDFQEGRWSSPLFSGQNYVHYQPIKHKTREHWPLDPEDRNSLGPDSLTLKIWRHTDNANYNTWSLWCLWKDGSFLTHWPMSISLNQLYPSGNRETPVKTWGLEGWNDVNYLYFPVDDIR